MRNVDKFAQVEIAITSSPMDLDSEYMWAMSNIDIYVTRNLRLTGIKKH